METYKILVVEKDLLARQAISRVLKNDGRFLVTSTPPEARPSERSITEINPDVVLLSIDSLESEEFETFTKLRVRLPNLPVVVLSPRNEEGAKAAITALSMGAVDVVTKPNRCNNLLFANRHLNKRLIPIIETGIAFGEESVHQSKKYEPDKYSQRNMGHAKIKEVKEHERKFEADLVVIGGCSGGPKALFSFLNKLPGNLSVPVVVVQHFPKIYTKILAEELDNRSRIRVRQAYDGAKLVPGIVWIAPGGYHTEIHRDGSKTRLRIHRGPRELGDRPSINILFRSAAKYFADKTLGIVLSGIGTDGLSGAEAIKAAGGQVLLQDPRQSSAPEMPARILQAGITNNLCRVEELVEQILNRVPESSKYSDTHSFERKKKLYGRNAFNSMDSMEFSTL